MKKMIKSNVILLLFAVLCFTSCKEPTARFEAPANATVGETIRIHNESMDADRYDWDFGDGITSNESNPSHAYSSEGVYYVKLTAYSKMGKSDVANTSINVTEATPELPQEPMPTALFTASTTNANAGDNICFANKSKDADHYVWDFGDGSSSTEPNPCHIYSTKGVYWVKLTAYSPSGESDFTGMYINVTEATPEEPTPTALFTASTTNASVDDVISFTNKSLNAHHYEWDFGDGQTSTDPDPSHAYSSKGVYHVQLTAYSPSGDKCGVAGMTINVEEATGSIMFWMNSPGYIVTVEVDGIKKEINGYYPNYNPECGDEGCATFNDLPVGEHYFRAESYDGWWSDYITIEKGVCKRMLLLRGKATPFKDGEKPEVEKRMAERIE